MSRILTEGGQDHVVLERDVIASTWERQRWDSFTLLTPNWATWLPRWHYTGDDPHGFMGREEIVAYLRDYAASFDAPVRPGCDVRRLEGAGGGGFVVRCDQGDLAARAVVIATGPFQRPRVPDWAKDLPGDIAQVHSSDYRSPARLPDGGVLVVGSGPSGQQIAEDLLRAGRAVHLAVGRHRRVPRRYRGRDYYWWLELGGFYEKTSQDVPPAARRGGGVAPALTGFGGGHDLDLRGLHRDGATLLGRALSARGALVSFDDSLASSLAEGDHGYTDFTTWVDDRLYRFDGMFDAPEPREAWPDPPPAPASIDLHRLGIGTVVWATGFRSGLGEWVEVPILDDDGQVRHDRGVTPVPGLYVVGQTWLHRLRSPFIRGAEEDVTHIGRHLADHLARD